MGSVDDYIRDLEKLLQSTEEKSDRVQKLKTKTFVDELEKLRKAIKMRPREFDERFDKDPKGTIALMITRYKRISKPG